MSKPTELSAVPIEPNLDIIDLLESLMEDAKAGRLVEVALFGRYEAGQIVSAEAGSRDDVFSMFGVMMDKALRYRDRNIIDD